MASRGRHGPLRGHNRGSGAADSTARGPGSAHGLEIPGVESPEPHHVAEVALGVSEERGQVGVAVGPEAPTRRGALADFDDAAAPATCWHPEILRQAPRGVIFG